MKLYIYKNELGGGGEGKLRSTIDLTQSTRGPSIKVCA